MTSETKETKGRTEPESAPHTVPSRAESLSSVTASQKKPLPFALFIIVALLIAAVAYFIGRGSAVTPSVANSDNAAATAEKTEAGA
jgi:uncharacterized protein HemX